MKINLNNGQKTDRVLIKIYSKICEPQSTYIFKNIDYEEEDGSKPDAYEIFKVLFIAACTCVGIDEELLAAFVLDEYGSLTPYVLDDKYLFGDVQMVDYKSYQEKCALTGEEIMPIGKYTTNRYNEFANTLIIKDGN